MEVEQRVESLEGEFKLIKGQVKQSMTDIRDFLQLGVPVPQAAPLSGAPLPEAPPIVIEIESSPPSGGGPEYEQLEEIVDEMPPAAGEEVPPFQEMPPLEEMPPFQEMPPLEEMPSDEAPPLEEMPSEEAPPLEEMPSEEAPPLEDMDSLTPEASQPSEEQLEDEQLEEIAEKELPKASKEEKMMEKASGSILQANQLPNLIRWVSVAKREIGSAQLPTFLEAYGVRGQLSSEMKEVILHLAAVVSEQSADASPADVWSRLTLELHGILTDGSG